MLFKPLLVLLTLLPSGVVTAGVPTLDEVRRSLAARDAAFRNIRFRVTFNYRARENFARGAPFFERVQVVDALTGTSEGLSAENKFKVDVLETPGPKLLREFKDKAPKRLHSLANHTATGSRTLTDTSNDGSLLGYIDQQYPRFAWATPPLELLGLNAWSLSEILFGSFARNPQVEGLETIDGHETIRLA